MARPGIRERLPGVESQNDEQITREWLRDKSPLPLLAKLRVIRFDEALTAQEHNQALARKLVDWRRQPQPPPTIDEFISSRGLVHVGRVSALEIDLDAI